MSTTPTIDLESRLAVNPQLVLREESDACALLFDPDSGRVHLLNPPAVAVWKLLDGNRSLNDVTAVLADEFDGMGADAAEQVVALARALADLGAVALLSGGD